VLREWLGHYFWQGVDAVLLLDNDSKDEWREVAREFPRTTSRLAPRRHKQEEQYNQLAVPWLYDMDIAIVIVVDLDEFLFSRDGRSLQEVRRGRGATSRRPSPRPTLLSRTLTK
jgi:hypothetical protein